MEMVSVNNSAESYDRLVHGGPPSGGDLQIVYKLKATAGGRGGVCISFSVEIEGKLYQVQEVTTAANLVNAAKAIQVWEAQQNN